MQIPGLSIASAPQVTGHPLGLPDAKQDPAPERKVQPVIGLRDADTARSSGPPAQFWRTANGGPDPATHVAPPSLVQIRISQMLDAQAEQKVEDAERDDMAPVDAEASPPLPSERKTDATETYPVGPNAKEDIERLESAAGTTLPVRGAYEEAASLSRKSVFSTLP